MQQLLRSNRRWLSLMTLVVFLCVTFFPLAAPAFAAATPEEALREKNIYIIADQATPIKCMLYNGKAKNGYFAYFQGRNRNGVMNNYPCYCVIPDQLGVNNLGNRDAELTQTVQSPRIYGAIMNGYPYKTPESLGLQSNKEAYYATRNVVWTLAGNWDYSLWKSDGTAQGIRVKAAMDAIYQAAQNWQSIPVALECKLTSTGPAQEKGAYVEQTYTITANYDATHLVEVMLKNAPASAKIVGSDGAEKTNFTVGEDITVRVPVADAQGADFDVKLYVQAKDNAVYYAKTAQTDCQDYYATFDPINTVVSDAVFQYKATPKPNQPSPGPGTPAASEGMVTVYKKDKENNPLAGAVFQVLKDGAEIGSFGTDSTGKFTFPIDTNTMVKTELPDPHDNTYIEHEEPLENGTAFNTYTIIEVEAPYGYLLGAENQQTITTIANGSGGVQQHDYTVTFVNEKYGNLLIQKTDKDTNKFLQGAVYRLTYLPGANDKHSFTTDVTTDGTGMCCVTGLKPGSYSIQEIKAPEGYLLDNRKETITITSNQTTTYHGTNAHKPGITIYKYDANEDAPLSGAIFRIQGIDNAFLGEYETGLSGYIQVDNLPAGSYQVTEVKAPAGYVIADEPMQTVELSPGQMSAQLVFENLKKAELTITKLDRDTQAAVGGTTFQIKGIDTNYNQSFVTDSQGVIHLDNLVPGSYEIRETVPAPGYSMEKQNQISVALEAGQHVKQVFYNQKLAVLDLLKVDKKNHQPLPGVTYSIQKKGGTIIGEYTTDQSGRILLDTLEEGWYTITEKAVPDGVILDKVAKDVYLKKGKTLSVTYENSIKPDLTIQKLDSITKDSLKGAKFQVWYAENGSSVGNLQELGSYTTDENGQIVLQKVEPGWYRLKEMAAPAGYEKATPDSIDVFMAADENQTITFENTPKSAIVIKKVDADTGKPLEGAYFRVRYLGGTSGTGGTVIGEYSTSVNGTAVITGLKAGTYVVEEISAPDGYMIGEAAKTVYLSGAQQDVITVVFGNDKKGSLLIMKKDAATDAPLSDVEFLVTDSAGGVIGNHNGRYVTDAAGTIRIDNLEPGISVIVKETKALPGYVLDDTPQTIKIKANETMTLEFLNHHKGGLVIVKKDAVTGMPLQGVTFKITNSEGLFVPDAEGAISSNGLYTTDENGQIVLEKLQPDTYVVTEVKTLPGYVLDATPQTVRVNTNDIQTLTFTNMPIGGLTIIKSDEETGKRIEGVTFEVQKLNGEVIGSYVTDRNGLIQLPQLEQGWYGVTELKAAKGYLLNATPQKVEVKNGETATLKITNRRASQIVIHKIDAATREGIYGATFILYDSNQKPVGQYTSDQNGYVYIDEGLTDGKYYLRELKPADGYKRDETLKTVYIRYGAASEIVWENTAIQGQIQIVKKSADDNPINGLPAGTLLEGAVFEIYDKAGNTIDTIKTDKNGRAVSRLLPLSRYTIREVKAPAYYAANQTVMNAYLEHEGQIVTFEVTNPSVQTGVSIQKTGYYEVLPGQPIKYTLMQIANASTVPLQSFYWRDTLPSQVVLDKIVTGTYNQNLRYKVVYKTNRSNGQYRTLADNLSTMKNHVLEARPVALQLAADERVTEVMFVFGNVKAGFAQVETPYIHGTVVKQLSNNSSFVNIADVGGLHNNEWVMGVSRWVTKVYTRVISSLPKTGY